MEFGSVSFLFTILMQVTVMAHRNAVRGGPRHGHRCTKHLKFGLRFRRYACRHTDNTLIAILRSLTGGGAKQMWRKCSKQQRYTNIADLSVAGVYVEWSESLMQCSDIASETRSLQRRLWRRSGLQCSYNVTACCRCVAGHGASQSSPLPFPPFP